jgi:hypothetical protein
MPPRLPHSGLPARLHGLDLAAGGRVFGDDRAPAGTARGTGLDLRSGRRGEVARLFHHPGRAGATPKDGFGDLDQRRAVLTLTKAV